MGSNLLAINIMKRNNALQKDDTLYSMGARAARARYGEPKVSLKNSSDQISRSVTSSTDILVALANHIVQVDKQSPGFRVYELPCAEIPVRSLIIQFTTPLVSLGRKVSLLNRPRSSLLLLVDYLVLHYYLGI